MICAPDQAKWFQGIEMNKPKVVPAEFLGWCRIYLDFQVSHWLPWELMVYSALERKSKLWQARINFWILTDY